MLLSKHDMALFRKIHPLKGFHMHRWGPRMAASVDRLTHSGLVTWATDSSYPGRSTPRMGNEVGVTQFIHRHMGIRVMLTPRGKQVRKKR